MNPLEQCIEISWKWCQSLNDCSKPSSSNVASCSFCILQHVCNHTWYVSLEEVYLSLLGSLCPLHLKVLTLSHHWQSQKPELLPSTPPWQCRLLNPSFFPSFRAFYLATSAFVSRGRPKRKQEDTLAETCPDLSLLAFSGISHKLCKNFPWNSLKTYGEIGHQNLPQKQKGIELPLNLAKCCSIH